MACFPMDPANSFSGPARAQWPGLVAALVFSAALACPFDAMAQQQLPTLPGGSAPLKTLPTDALGQITPAWPPKKASSPAQVIPGVVPNYSPAMQLPPSPQPQPIPCAAFKGSAADMAALRQTAREAAGRRAIPGTAFDPLIPKNCAGQEWAFYLRFLGNVGEGAL